MQNIFVFLLQHFLKDIVNNISLQLLFLFYIFFRPLLEDFITKDFQSIAIQQHVAVVLFKLLTLCSISGLEL